MFVGEFNYIEIDSVSSASIFSGDIDIQYNPSTVKKQQNKAV